MEPGLAQTGGKQIPTDQQHESDEGGSGAIMLMTVLQLRRHMAFVVEIFTSTSAVALSLAARHP